MPDRIDSSLIALRQILKATTTNVRQLASKAGLTASQLLVLQILSTRGEMLAGDLARAVDLKQATISILLDRLQEQGLISRTRGETDRRRVWITITETGRDRLRTAPGLLQQSFRTRFSELEDWEQAYLEAALMRIATLLDADKLEASPVLAYDDIHALPEDEGLENGAG